MAKKASAIHYPLHLGHNHHDQDPDRLFAIHSFFYCIQSDWTRLQRVSA